MLFETYPRNTRFLNPIVAQPVIAADRFARDRALFEGQSGALAAAECQAVGRSSIIARYVPILPRRLQLGAYIPYDVIASIATPHFPRRCGGWIWTAYRRAVCDPRPSSLVPSISAWKCAGHGARGWTCARSNASAARRPAMALGCT